MTKSNMQRSGQTDDDHEWIERASKTVYDLASIRKQSEKHEDFIIKSSDPILLGCIGLAIEQHLEAIPSKLRPIFEQMLDNYHIYVEFGKQLDLVLIVAAAVVVVAVDSI